MKANHAILPPLGSGRTLGIIALSSPTEQARFALALNEMDRLGVPYKVALNPSKNYGSKTDLFSSDTAELRARALHELAVDPSVGAVMAARGGGGALELLPLLDFDLLSRHPKPLVGFSDTTALLVALTERAGWPCIHGPSVEGAFAMAEQSAECKASGERIVQILRGMERPLQGVRVRPIVGKESVRGPLLGGNLSIVTALSGTPWQPSLEGKILFLEEIAERPYKIHRMMLQLKYAGVLRGCKGILLGSFRDCVHPKGEGPALEEIFQAVCGELKLPVFGYISSGHCSDNRAVPFGRSIEISEDGEISM